MRKGLKEMKMLRMWMKLMKNGEQLSFALLLPPLMMPHCLKPGWTLEVEEGVEGGLKDALDLCLFYLPHPLDCCHCFHPDFGQQMVDNLMMHWEL